ncbi:MAG TPA: carboxypeptidase regulatory-like domain-containing protein [Vicinamibacterales bacterium]|nr:carboxypeptidase regulatory-like domain-containing protein [Vicinamibacterales bacterium]
MKRLLNATLWLGGRMVVCLMLCALALPSAAAAQGVTTGSIGGIVKDAQEKPVARATVLALHVPSGTTYEATTRADGRYTIPGMRIGGPYSVTVAPASGAAGFEPQTQDDIVVTLGVSTDLDFIVRSIAVEVTVTGQSSDAVFSSERTGAATAITRDALATLPTISGRLESVTRLSPQSGGNMQFAGQDNRLNNITVDGSYFNNSFGLAGTPGERTGVAPISLYAIEQVQINVAPFDVRQGNFVGAGVNTVTRSGGNQFRGSFYHQFRDEGLVGTEAKSLEVDPGTFSFRNTGGWASGPVVPSKLFFFGNYENEKLTAPGTTFRANTGGEPAAGSVTRVLETDLNELSSYLAQNFDYETGPYQGYDHLTPAKRFLVKTDWNINDKNKFSFRYNQLDSDTDVLVSDSSSLGFGSRRTRTTGLNFQNSNYQILENIKSGIGELNTILSDTMANNLIIGYGSSDESRASRGTFFPMVDILEAGTVYTTFGFEPFTPNNELRYNSFQFINNFTKFANKHTFTGGVSVERYESENVFFPGSQSAYVYNSLDDFYTDANGFLANPNRTTSPVNLRRFQVRWSNIPGLEKPIQPLEVLYSGVYAQDSWRMRDNVTVNLGLRVDVPKFGDTGFANAAADALTFREEDGSPVQYSTAKLPDASPHWSPRAGFNWDVNGNKTMQIRGGTGIFTGRPAYVWISNQIGNTGVLTGFASIDNTTTRPFHPDPDHYKPAEVTGAPASSYELALTDPDFKFPQLWRNNIAVDQRLPWGWTGTAEFIYNRDVNGIYYINANLPGPTGAFAGADGRPRWVGSNSNRIHSNVSNAIVLKNQDVGRSWNTAFSVEKTSTAGLWVKAAYSYGQAKNTVDAGSIAFGSWNNNQHSGDPNNPGLGYSNQGHRFFAAASYSREYFSFGKTTVSLFWESFNAGAASYTLSGDLNGDGGTSNDLIYIPRDTSEMNFQAFGSFTADAQAQAWNAYIEQDEYLSKNRGKYAQRGGVLLPIVSRMDLGFHQDIFTNMGGRRHEFQFRTDVLNFGNLLNKNWGVGQRLVNAQPLIVPTTAQGGPADASGRAQYRLRTIDNQLMTKSLEQTAGLSDVWRVQFSVRYSFN